MDENLIDTATGEYVKLPFYQKPDTNKTVIDEAYLLGKNAGLLDEDLVIFIDIINWSCFPRPNYSNWTKENIEGVLSTNKYVIDKLILMIKSHKGEEYEWFTEEGEERKFSNSLRKHLKLTYGDRYIHYATLEAIQNEETPRKLLHWENLIKEFWKTQ